jgi:hypothetical protein
MSSGQVWPDLVGGDAEPFGLRLVDAERIQRRDEVEPVLARRDEADLGAGLAMHPPVDAVGAREKASAAKRL